MIPIVSPDIGLPPLDTCSEQEFRQLSPCELLESSHPLEHHTQAGSAKQVLQLLAVH
jgi:hypothetical protein